MLISAGAKAEATTADEIMQKDNSNSSAGTKAGCEQNDQDLSVSQHNAKPLVVGSQCHGTPIESHVVGLPSSSDDESEKYAEDYVKRLKQRHLDFAALLNSGYFLSTIAIISFVELANSIINFPKSAHFLATS